MQMFMLLLLLFLVGDAICPSVISREKCIIVVVIELTGTTSHVHDLYASISGMYAKGWVYTERLRLATAAAEAARIESTSSSAVLL